MASTLADPGSLADLPFAGLLLELDGTIIDANAAAIRLAARTLAGMPIGDLSPGIVSRWATLVERARSTGHAVAELDIDNRPLHLALSIVTTDGRARAVGFVLELPVRKADAEALQTGAHQRLESLGLVAGGIAHDFNNLLVGVLAEASAAREDRDLAEGTREALRRIEAAARRMAQLTRQLLAYSGRGQFKTVPIAVDELVGELREVITRVVRPSVVLEIVPGAPGAVVEGDAGLLRQVVLALASNASDAGGSRVDIATRIISRDGVPFWLLEVGDDGAGIDAATLPRIFEPFFSTKANHHGLGLSAVHGVVRRLGGDIDVDTRVAHGSRFRVHLPIALGAEPAPRHSTEAMVPILRLTGVRALVADDEPSVRATVRRLLERRGATVVVASDGLEAEARLRDEPFQLVVSDVSMPGRGGYEVLVIARAVQPGVRVVLMSGYTEKVRGDGVEEEPDAFVEKPFTAKTLDAAVDEVLKGKG